MSSDRVLVTGGSSGIGKSIVEHLSTDYTVITLARRLERMEQEFEDFDTVHPYKFDLAEFEAFDQLLQEITEDHGNISYVVNNAAVNLGGDVSSINIKDVEQSLRINALAPMKILQSVLPQMQQENFGRIINITSGAPLNCPEGAVAYSSSKAALNTVTVTAAKEHADSNIKINLMSPGPCKTEMAPNAPLNPSECHETVDYLLSLDASGPTGKFFWLGNEVPLFPELGDVAWEEGEPSEYMTRVL